MIIKNKFFYGYWIVLAGFATMALYSGLIFYGFSVLNKPIGDEFGWGRGVVVAAFAIFMFAAAAVSPLVGRLGDRRGPRQVFLFGTIVTLLALVLLSRTSAIWHFYLLHLFLGVGFMLLGTVPLSMLLSNWFYRLRGTMQGMAFTGIGIGGLVLAPLIGNYLIPNLGWRNTYLVMAFILLVIMLPLLLFVFKDYPHQKGLLPYGQEEAKVMGDNGSKTEGATGLNLREVLGTPAFWIVAFTFAVYGMSVTAALQNQVSILTEQGFAATSAVAAIGIAGLFSAVGKLLFGYLCDHINPKYAVAISSAMIGFSLVTMIQVRSRAHLWLYAVLIGLGMGGWAPNLAMLSANYFGLKHYGVVLGTLYLVFNVGEGIGPMVAGFVYDQSGSYHMVLAVLAGLCFISVFAIAVIRKPQIASN